jgi:hypothetical protein
MKNNSFARMLMIGAIFIALPFAAGAHAFLDHAEPGVGRKVRSAPAMIKLWFTQNIEPAFSKVRVEDSSGKEVDKKDVHVDEKEKPVMMVSVPDLPPGKYTVTWSVVSVDTHRTQGHFEFTVAP